MVIIKLNYYVSYKVQFELSQYIVIFHAVEIINYLLCSESSISYKNSIFNVQEKYHSEIKCRKFYHIYRLPFIDTS